MLFVMVGRMNPPHCGHEKIIEDMWATAMSVVACGHLVDRMIITTETHDKKNPLALVDKHKFIKKAFPEVVISCSKNWVKAIEAYSTRYTHIVLFCGSDRAEAYLRICDDLEDKYPNCVFNVAEVVRSDQGNDPSDRISGTKMREYAAQDNFNMFYLNLPENLQNNKDAKEIFELCKPSMTMNLKSGRTKSTAKRTGSGSKTITAPGTDQKRTG